MKDKHMNRSHISERSFRQIIQLFAVDLPAAQISEIIKISRPTINAILSRIRERIAKLSEQESFFTSGEIEIDESYFGARRVRGKRGRGAYGKTKVFCMKKRGDKVYTQIVKNCSASELVPIIKKLAPDDSVIYSDEWKAYDGLVNLGYDKHYRVKHSEDVFSNGKAHINRIESFWGIAKTRLVKFRGIRADQFYLHLKETEFRFNHRQENLYLLLLKEFRTNPL
jgi:transposase